MGWHLEASLSNKVQLPFRVRLVAKLPRRRRRYYRPHSKPRRSCLSGRNPRLSIPAQFDPLQKAPCCLAPHPIGLDEQKSYPDPLEMYQVEAGVLPIAQ